MKKRGIGAILFVFVLLSCGGNAPPPQGKPETSPAPKTAVEREKTEKENPLPPEVKIKLKRDGKENYSWELSGSDADQVLKVNEKLKKQLGGEKSK
jgi:hypothetical protein